MNSENKENLLDRYVKGEALSTEEEQKIEHLLATDTAYRAEFRARMALFEAGKQQRRAAWAASREQSAPKTIKFTPQPMRWVAAASVVVLLGVGLGWWLYRSTGSATMELAVYERYENQQGIATVGAKPVDHIVLAVSESKELRYQFNTYDTLRVFTPETGLWRNNEWKITRLSEANYELENRAGTIKYGIEQGRNAILPLRQIEPENR